MKSLDRCAAAARNTAEAVTHWCKENNESPGRLELKLEDAESFMIRLYEALHTEKGPFSDEKYSFWSHRSIDGLLRLKPSQRSLIVDRSRLRKLATEYLQEPWLHNPYLDWVFVDALTIAELVGALEWYRQQKFGLSYALFDGNRFYMVLWKLVTIPLSVAIGWLLPAYLFYLLFGWSAWLALGLAAVYYALNLGMLAKWFGHKIWALLSRSPTPLQKVEHLIEEMEKVYSLLTGPVIHIETFRRALDKAGDDGVGWDQQLFYILDKLAEQRPKLWDASYRSTYA